MALIPLMNWSRGSLLSVSVGCGDLLGMLSLGQFWDRNEIIGYGYFGGIGDKP